MFITKMKFYNFSSYVLKYHLLHFFVLKIQQKYDAEIEAKVNIPTHIKVLKWKLKSESCADHMCCNVTDTSNNCKECNLWSNQLGKHLKSLTNENIAKGTFLWHMKISSGTKSHKCYRFCIFLGRQFGDTIKTSSVEKSNNYNHCDFASSQTCDFRIMMKTHNEERS